MDEETSVVWLEACRRTDVAVVGGKNASLGEMLCTLSEQGIRVPPGFATTASAFRRYLTENQLETVMDDKLARLADGRATLAETGESIRSAICGGSFPEAIRAPLIEHYRALGERLGRSDVAVAVRSSATAEDLPDASFAGQQETFLNVVGEADLLEAARQCFASLFTDRAIAYREAKGFDHKKVALSVGVQAMVRADAGGSGVMFSIDPESGFDKVVVINAAWGLGETVVQGAVDPDEYAVFKPLLDVSDTVPIVEKRRGAKAIKMVYGNAAERTRTLPTSKRERLTFVLDDEEILTLARWAVRIEAHYGVPMDIEWARDGENGPLFIVQARPETVRSREDEGTVSTVRVSGAGKVLLEGLAVGSAAVSGEVCLIEDTADLDTFVDGAILVTGTTDPDWVPIMKRAAGIITDHGGRTSHAAIVSRELGLPAVVGTGDATHLLHSGQSVTLSCAEGDVGTITEGVATIAHDTISITDLPQTRTKVMLNLANPSAAFRWWRLPIDGVGLARMEFVIANQIRVHPMALVRFDQLNDPAAKATIEALTSGYEDKSEYFVDRLSRGLARIAAAAHPKRVIVRMSDFKTNEYAGLIGGAELEPHEENPMIGFRGASRYYSPAYREGFALECRAIARLRVDMGFRNVAMMIPFCRSISEADKVLEVMAENGLVRGEEGLEVFVMCEIPSNVVLADAFAQRFDGFSIGSNDLTQLTLGVDRDSEALADLFDEGDAAVKWMIERVIDSAHRAGAVVGLCGQAPSDDPEFAAFLVAQGIDSISVTPDSFVAVKSVVADAESGAEEQPTPLRQARS